MIPPKNIVTEARTFLGTPYLHQGRIKGTAIDCIGLPILVAKNLGLGDFDVSNYPRTPDGSFLGLIKAVCQPCVLQPGVLLVFKISVEAQHCGFVTDFHLGGNGLIHAWDIVDSVAEHRLTKDWLSKTVGCFGLPGVEYG